ncbi:MAG: proline--tRNA ligase [Candidatus Absconditabacteria bacterium]
MNTNNRQKVKMTSRDEDYSQWYLDVAKAGNMYMNSPTPGCITFMPKAVSIWVKIREEVSKVLQSKGVQDIYLPLLIPMSFLEKEKEHVEGFAPECAIVTHGGGKQLAEKLVIRPTSETLFCDFFKQQLSSYKDLPLLYNQWVNVMRWEKRTRPFLRTTEFYWQEGHTLHETKTEADEFALSIHNDVYLKTIRELIAVDGIAGQKPESEKFAGAMKTYTFEGMMSNGWALQMATSHLLGQGFMEQFEVKFQGSDGNMTYPYYTSWGISTRLLGGMISSHSDDKGLIIPPKLSEYKAVILPIYGKENQEQIDNYIFQLANSGMEQPLEIPVKGKNFTAIVDGLDKILIDKRQVKLGEKINDFEVSGFPIRAVVGAKELENRQITLVSRITGETRLVEFEEFGESIDEMLYLGQKHLFEKSKERLVNNVIPAYCFEDIARIVENKQFAIYDWDGSEEFEEKLKTELKATIRCIPFPGQFTDDLLEKQDTNNQIIIIARAF